MAARPAVIAGADEVVTFDAGRIGGRMGRIAQDGVAARVEAVA